MLLTDAVQQVTPDPQIIGNPQRTAGFALDAAIADLELPLTRHDFGIDAINQHAGSEAGLGVILNDLAAVDVLRASATVVGALGRRKTFLWEP